MERKFILYIKPFSVNRMYCSSRTMKTTEAKEWSAQVLYALGDPLIKQYLADLREFFNPKKHFYVFEFCCKYPKSIFFNKSGEISSKTLDITNFEKPLQDLLCDPKYFDLESPYGAENLCINDKHIVKMTSTKKPSDIYSIEISIKIIDCEELQNL